MPPGSSRIGLFGGSFNPIHVGHLILAERAAEELELDKVYFIPNAVSPLKSAESNAPGRDRLAMVRAAVRGNQRFAVLDDEVRRGGTSYTFDTVAALSKRTSDKLYFLIGTDAVSDLDRWHRARELARRVTFAVFRRPGSVGAQPPPWAGNWVDVGSPLIDISSSEIRDRIRRGRSIRYLVPDAAAAIVRKRRLYRNP
jgi:nicotinate-nucleotide adenylyltransferase